jgi:hypothetical protein
MSGLLRSATALLLLTPLCTHAGPVASDAELEHRGARIGNIAIEVDDVFGDHDAPCRSLSGREQSTHISTHDSNGAAAAAVPHGRRYSIGAYSMKRRACCVLSAIHEASVERPLQRSRQHRGRAGARARRLDAEPRRVVRSQGRREQHARAVRRSQFPRARQRAVAGRDRATSIAAPGSSATSIRTCSAAGGGWRPVTRR